MAELLTYGPLYTRFPLYPVGLLKQLCRLNESLIFRMAVAIANDPEEPNILFQVDEIHGLLYCRWDNYVRYSRGIMLLLLQTGIVRQFILHCCHVSDNWRYAEPHVYNPNRRAAFDEVQDIIDNLDNPENTNFFVDSPLGLHSYRTRQFPPCPVCTFQIGGHNSYCGLWVNFLRSPNRIGCMCCCNGCHSLPSLRYSVCVINPNTGRATFHWLMWYTCLLY